MKFLGNLGIDLKLLIAQMINFGLLLWLLAKFLYKPIIKRIENDERQLGQAEKQKERLAKQQEELEKQKKQQMAETRKKAREIVKEAEDIAKELEERAKKEAEKEKQAVIAQIKTRLNELDNEQ